MSAKRPTLTERMEALEARLRYVESLVVRTTPKATEAPSRYTDTNSSEDGCGVNADPLDPDHAMPPTSDTSPTLLCTVDLAESVTDWMWEAARVIQTHKVALSAEEDSVELDDLVRTLKGYARTLGDCAMSTRLTHGYVE